jgi:acyl carrier protein
MGMEMVEIVLEVEEQFRVKIEIEDAEKLATVGQLHDYILKRLPADSPLRLPESHRPAATGNATPLAFDKQGRQLGALCYRLQILVAEVLGVDPRVVGPESHFVKDLGVG